jgi:class 3 adenylate cyclase/predicted ATPase
MPDTASWLARLGLTKYIETFTENEVDLDALRHLSDDDLKELGLPIGPRRKILAAMAILEDRDPSLTRSRAAPARPRREAERRQLTVMFVDLVGSTELSQRLDPEEMRDVIGAYHGAVSTAITRYDGQVAKLMGDGVLVYFGWPRAHENAAERAIRAALAAIPAVATLKTPRGNPLSARIGIATGLVVVGDLIGEGSAQEEAVVGETPNLSARLQAVAEPNTVVVADSTYRLVTGLFDSVDMGRRELKGFAVPVHAWRIAGEAEAFGALDARHGLSTPLVGRAEELKLLLERWQQARTGNGQVVLLSAEPGIGKSRLIAALQERLGDEPRALLCYFCSAYHVNSSFHPIIKQLERVADIRRDDDNDTKLDKLRALLGQTISDVAETNALLAELLSIESTGRHPPLEMTAQARKARTVAVLIDLLKSLAAQRPVMMVVEDAHWIDPTTSEWLDSVIDSLRELPVLLIVSFRPEFKSHWVALPHVTELSLSRLSRDEGAAIADRIAGGKTLPCEVKDQILAKTEGVPLFVEELTKTVIEGDFLTDDGDRYVLSRPLPPLAIPSTLQDSLMARLDRLDRVKEVAQAGACIGRAFQYRLLAAVTGLDERRLDHALQQLEKSELVFRRGRRPEASYTFKHALIQDTAYQSLLKSRRQQIHTAIAGRLQSDFPEIVLAEPETLAHHYSAAGLPEQAVTYWLKAGQAALKRSANLEASAHLSKGIDLVASLPDCEERLRQEIQLHSALGLTMMGAKGFGAPDVLRAFSRSRVLSEKLGDHGQLFIALCGEASYHMISGNLRAADELGRRCLELAQTGGDESMMLEAHHRQWATKFFMGDYAAAEQHADRGLATYNPDDHHSLTYMYTGHDPGVCCRSYSSSMLWLRGYPDQAVERGQEAVALAERVSHRFSLALAEHGLSEVHLMRREPAEARRWIKKWGASSTELMLPLMTSQARFQLGWALAEEGHAEEGIAEMREGIAAMTATGAAMGMQHFLCVLAGALGEHGLVGEGLALLERAFEMVTKSGAKYQLPELLRRKGELLLRLKPCDDPAENWFRQAVTLAHNEGTKSLELRAALSLARLYLAQARDAEARDVLSPVYACFTEGFGTRDLVEAKTLLDQLR